MNILDDADETVVLAGVVGNQAVGGSRQPVQHGALLQVPGLRFGHALELARLHIDEADHGGISGGGRTVMEVGLQAEVILAG